MDTATGRTTADHTIHAHQRHMTWDNSREPAIRAAPGSVSRHLDAKGYEVTTGIGPDLMEAARNAVRGMIDCLGVAQKMTPEDAYMLCSVCADMRISEVVDQPNWVVSCTIPRLVFA